METMAELKLLRRRVFLTCLFIIVVLQISDEAKKFAYQTGIRVVVAYGGAPVHNQVYFDSLNVLSKLLSVFLLRL